MHTLTPPAAALLPRMVGLPAGAFDMGATDDDKFAGTLERPRRRVTIDRPFDLAACPVTFDEFDAYARAAGVPRPREGGFGRGSLPVVNVAWREAAAYAAWLSDATGERFRLPTEAEWEYACRAGTTGVFHTGSDLTPTQANYLYSEVREKVGLGRPTPVGSYPPNPWGLHDMHGNVLEFVADHWHDGYHGAPPDGRAWLADGPNPLRVVRGGAWDELPRLLRAAYRDWVHEDTRFDNVGFRVARDPRP